MLLGCIREERFEVFTAVKIQVEVFWVVTMCSDTIGYRRFGGLCRKVSYCNITLRHNPQDLRNWNRKVSN